MDEQLLVVLKLKGKKLQSGYLEDWVVGSYFGADVVFATHQWDDGHISSLRTSTPIIFHNNDTILETRNSIYRLGKKRELDSKE